MPEAVIVEVADALTDALNAHDFGQRFKAERSYADWSEELKELDCLKVDVVPWSASPEQDSEGSFDWPMLIDVLIRKRFGPNEQQVSDGRIRLAEIDELVKLTQDIWEWFSPKTPNQTGRLTTASAYSAAWNHETTRMMAIYVRPHLRAMRQYTGWLRLGFAVQT